MPKSLAILGAGYTARIILPLATQQYATVWATSRDPDHRLDDIPPDQRIWFNLDQPDTWNNIPADCDVLWCFPAEPLDQVQACAAVMNLPSRRLVVLGSTSAYPTGTVDEYPPAWIDETASIDERIPRVKGEEYLRTNCHAIILRVSGIYGPRRNPLTWIQRGRVGSSRKFVNLIHVEDLAEVCLAALKYGQPGEAYTVSDGIPRTWEEICRTAQDRWGIISTRTTDDQSTGKRLAVNKLMSLLETSGKTLVHTDLYQSLNRLLSEPSATEAGP